MRNILNIAAKEIRVSFVTPLAYVVIAGFMLLAAFFFFSLLSHFNVQLMQTALTPNIVPSLNEWVIVPFYQTLEIVLIFLVPILTMRAIAEERRMGTFEMLITSPLSVTEIVLGKFIGVSAIVLIMLVLSFVYPLSVVLFADPEVPPVFVGLGGLVLFALSFVALGIAVSACTRNQTVAGVLGLVVLLVFYVLDAPAQMLGGRAADLLKYLAPANHADIMLKGMITGTAILYFVSVMLFGLFCACRALDAERWR
jgi:ABC-2 type transport system permease protein